MTKYYKVLAEGAKSCHGGDQTWPRPRGNRPGKWVRVKGEIVLCSNGLHVVTAAHVLDWGGREVWEVEIDGETVTDGKKIAARSARLVRLVMDEWALRRFAVECAARVLHLFERERPRDDRIRECLRVCGNPSAGNAARAAAGAAAGNAAWDAARDAARAAAWAAAGAAAGNAARAAAGAAARDAAGAAAWNAARDAAWNAAWAAARDAERAWQVKRLKRYLAGKVDLTKPVRLPPKVKP